MALSEKTKQAVAVWSCENVSVIGCTSRGQCYAGISLTISYNCTVTGCVSEYQIWNESQQQQPNGDGSYGIEIEGGYGHTISGNILPNNCGAGVFMHVWFDAGTADACHAHTLTGNSVIYDDPNAYLSNPSGFYIVAHYAGALEDVTITGNSVYWTTAVRNAIAGKTGGWGVFAQQTNGTIDRLHIAENVFRNPPNNAVYTQVSQVDMHSNVVYGAGNPGFQIQSPSSTPLTGSIKDNRAVGCNPGIQVQTATALSITGNIIEKNYNIGIELSSVTNSDISHNIVLNTLNNGPGIQLNGTTTGNTLIGNQCIDNQTTHTQTYGIQEQTGATGNVYDNNTLSGNATAPIQFSSGSTSVARNNVGYNPVGSITTPASPLASGTVYQNTSNVDLTIYQPVYATTAGTAGSVAIALGASSTPATIATEYVSGGTTSAAPYTAVLRVPAGQYYSFTGSAVTLLAATMMGD